jgi:uncharacterized membrane protein
MEAIGPVLVLASIPLILRWIPQNRIFGFRVPATLRNKSVWYDANALSGRHLFLLGLFMVLLEFALPPSIRTWTLRFTAIAGLVVITVVDWKTANRWERERRRAH